MSRIINSIFIILLLISCIGNVLLLNRLENKTNELIEIYDTKPELMFVVDSVEIFDTCFFNHFDTVILETIKKDTITKLDSIFVFDSVEVFLPINTYKFDTTLNETHINLICEGFDVRLNTLLVERINVVHEQEKAVKTNRFGLGLQLGIGVNEKGFTPYIGIGLNYRLL